MTYVKKRSILYCYSDNVEGFLDKLSHGVSLSSGKNEIIGCRLLEHAPHALDIVLGYYNTWLVRDDDAAVSSHTMSPVSLGINVTEIQTVLLADANICNGPSDFPGDERPPSPRALVVEKNPVTRIHTVRLAVVHRDPVCVQLGNTVRAARIERCRLALWSLNDFSVEFGGRGLVEARVLVKPNGADGIEETQGAEAIDIGSVF
jgi:hypothetical protein